MELKHKELKTVGSVVAEKGEALSLEGVSKMDAILRLPAIVRPAFDLVLGFEV